MLKLSLETTQHVLTLSASYTPPQGGIAQVIQTYSTMYPVFNHVATKRGDTSFEKIAALSLALFKFTYYCLFRKIRIVHVHGASNNSFWRKRIFISLAKVFRKKVVYHVHGAEYKDFYSNNPEPVKSVFNKVDTIIALSESWRVFFEESIGHQDVRVIENVVSPPTIHTVKKDSRIRFLFLGEFGHRKGIYDLLDSIFDNLESIKEKAVFHLAGNGEVGKVRQRISELGLEEVIAFEGWVSGERKVKLLNLADVYILPSYNEGLPISVLEAMSYSIPVISTPVGGIPEIVGDNENGLLVQPGDKTVLGDAIVRMIEDCSFRETAGEKSFVKVQPYFRENVAGKLECMYRSLLGRGS